DKPRQLRKLNHIATDIGRLIWCAVGAATGIGLALWFVGVPSSPFLLASLGGSTVFLFGLTRAAAAQPRALLGGHLGSALIGVLCFRAFGDALWVYMLAEVLTLIFMLATKTVRDGLEVLDSRGAVLSGGPPWFTSLPLPWAA